MLFLVGVGIAVLHDLPGADRGGAVVGVLILALNGTSHLALVGSALVPRQERALTLIHDASIAVTAGVVISLLAVTPWVGIVGILPSGVIFLPMPAAAVILSRADADGPAAA